MAYSRDPRTKEELLDRMLRFDFKGDIREVGLEPAVLTRTGRNRLELRFPASGVTYELEVHRPREKPAQPSARSRARSGPSERSFASTEPPGQPGEAQGAGEGQPVRRRPGRPRSQPGRSG